MHERISLHTNNNSLDDLIKFKFNRFCVSVEGNLLAAKPRLLAQAEGI
jgi:hypothetical protein